MLVVAGAYALQGNLRKGQASAKDKFQVSWDKQRNFQDQLTGQLEVGNIKNEANAGFTANGATIGLCWDSTGYNLRNDGYKYIAPAEGAFAWHQGFVLMKNAANPTDFFRIEGWHEGPGTPKAALLGFTLGDVQDHEFDPAWAAQVALAIGFDDDVVAPAREGFGIAPQLVDQAGHVDGVVEDDDAAVADQRRNAAHAEHLE